MTFTEFKHILAARGFCKSEIMRLNRLGYESAADAHAELKRTMPQKFHPFCASIGRDFVIENLADFTKMIKK